MGFFRQEHWSGLQFPSPKGTIERKKVKSLSHVQLFATAWTVACQAPASMEFSRQEDWSGVPLPSPGSNLTLQAFAECLLCLGTPVSPWLKSISPRSSCYPAGTRCHSAKELAAQSCGRLFAAPWTVASVHGILQATALEWVAVSFSILC